MRGVPSCWERKLLKQRAERKCGNWRTANRMSASGWTDSRRTAQRWA